MSDNKLSSQKNILPKGEELSGHGFAIIFDMDGTLVDNTPFHYKAWQLLFKKHNLPELSRETYKREISGVPILNTVVRYFPDADAEEQNAIVEEKQEFYRQEYLPYLRAINGLENFLAELKDAGVKMAVATSSDMNDVDFVFNIVPIRQYFDTIIIGSMVSEPKPSPQIFLKAAQHLNIRPEKCIVFEDSTSGLQAGNNAGMKVVGITTAHPAEVISRVASLVINDYADISLHKLAALFDE
jgi:beta-phosphoglucomutase